MLLSALGNDDEELELASSRSSRIVAGGDVFLLCSDGVWEHIPDLNLEQLLAQAKTPQDWLASIESAIQDVTIGRHSHDNYTALALWLDGAPDV